MHALQHKAWVRPAEAQVPVHVQQCMPGHIKAMAAGNWQQHSLDDQHFGMYNSARSCISSGAIHSYTRSSSYCSRLDCLLQASHVWLLRW
jgi:hypothetical protein